MDGEITGIPKMDSHDVSETEQSKPAASDLTIAPGEQIAPAGSSALPPKPAPPLDLNELQDYSAHDLQSLAGDLDFRLYPARSRHQHILDLVRAALGRGGV